MGLEKLSAREVDHPKNDEKAPDKKEAVEHLRVLRNVLTPFIGDYVSSVRENGVSKPNPEFLELEEYKPEMSPNYSSLTSCMDFLGFGMNELPSLLRNQEIGGIGYKEFLRRTNRKDSPMSEIHFENHIEVIIEEMKKGFNSESVSPLFAQVAAFAEHNAGHLNNEQEIWDKKFKVKNAPQILFGKSWSKENSKMLPPFVVIPVGEYGPTVAKKIYETVEIMLKSTSVLEEKSAQLVEAHKDIFAKTARGEEDLRLLNDMSMAALKALQEGIVTLGQAVAQLSSEKKDGYDDSEKFIEDLIKAELPNQLGYLAPPGYIGPFSLMGKYLSELVQKDAQGKLILNPHILDEMQKIKQALSTGEIKEAQDQELDRLPSRGRGCPVSFKGQGIQTSGINELSQLFLEIYKARE